MEKKHPMHFIAANCEHGLIAELKDDNRSGFGKENNNNND